MIEVFRYQTDDAMPSIRLKPAMDCRWAKGRKMFATAEM